MGLFDRFKKKTKAAADSNEITIQADSDEAREIIQKREEMLSKSNGKRTVPQIFVNDYHVGGYDELNSLVQKGEFDSILMNE